jgi:hypothetical protein
MANTGLPISRLISVGVSLSAAAAQAANTSTLLILGTSTVIDLTTRVRTYTTISEVAADFGTSAPEYLAAVLWFEQNPQPTTLKIGRWANAPASGQLIGGVLSASQQASLVAAAVTTGSFDITIGGTPQTVTGISFAAGASMSAVAAAITTAASADGFTCAWSQSTQQFIFTTTATGASASASFLSAASSGANLSTALGGTAATGAYLAAGQAAETALAAVTLFDQQFGQQWYAVTVLQAADADHEVIAPYIEASANFHYYGITTQEAAVLSAGSTTDIAYIMAQGKYTRTGVQYSSTNTYAVVSLLGRILTTNYTGNNTTITLFYKQEPGITAETLTESQIDVLESKNCNVFVNYSNTSAIIEPGVSSSGDFIDTVMGAAAFAIAVQTALYNTLYTSTTKIPQTDGGMNILGNSILAVCAQFVANGLFAPGTWQNTPLPGMPSNLYLQNGYYLYIPPIASQSQASRAARQSVPFQLACKLAGAVHTVDLSVTVNA